ncbi:hypothetical protein K7432_014530 [Basidiobolus ranarum]|uniref:Uncharacterized protein n=1 Tax=Basidiobolus ranarum TaxID=34480 RepID=A0ABR2WHM7_9FUNG
MDFMSEIVSRVNRPLSYEWNSIRLRSAGLENPMEMERHYLRSHTIVNIDDQFVSSMST